MGEIGKISQWVFSLGGMQFKVNSETLIMTWVVMALTVVFAWLATRRKARVPGPWQHISELLVEWFKDLVREALGEEYVRRYFPLICALFIFLLLCNWIGIIPFLSEPTKDINTTLGLGIMGFFIAHGTAIKKKGLKLYIKEYFQPIFFMMPLNVVGEIAKVISISFRLFGNIMGGGIIIIVVSQLLYGLVLPPFLYAFFGLFVGTVQAFVFMMLTLVYISVQIR
ncbi:MAG: F0F1 ATP synthase subunit A [Deltaproteobacteria bacterium]|nr:F0F1 ATP synthase subunit A [Deltaproteobacteria bacterium]MBW2070947.1 F0F1 ATP synthase subunit A [Deltaproteobacteria bacterium]